MPSTYISAAPVASSNGYVTSVAMKVGAYALAATAPTSGARRVTCTRTVVGGADTPGILTVVGKDLSGQEITETLTPGNHSILVTGTLFFASVSSVTGAGWVTNTGDDTIVVGWDATLVVATGAGRLYSLSITETAAGIITIYDGTRTLGVLKASIVEGTHMFGPGIPFSNYLRIDPAAASKIIVVHSESQPTTYSL
jgi:hypothetical protein